MFEFLVYIDHKTAKLYENIWIMRQLSVTEQV